MLVVAFYKYKDHALQHFLLFHLLFQRYRMMFNTHLREKNIVLKSIKYAHALSFNVTCRIIVGIKPLIRISPCNLIFVILSKND